MKTTLAIETSCDDTSLAIVRYEDGSFFVDQLQAYSQIAHHQQYGWVVPEIAFRLHSEQILALLKHFENAVPTVDSICVTTNPGLAGSLLVWKTVAHMVGKHYDKPVVPVHHIYGHIFSLLLERRVADLPFPWIVLTASWGHNEIYHVEREEWEMKWKELILSDLTITKLWKTLDDAAGECFDKVARMLGGPYPWGQWIGEQALLGKPNSTFRFKRIMLADNDNAFDFSFSGMKSQAYSMLQKLEREWIALEWQVIYDIAYEFQEALIEVLAYKLLTAATQYKAATVGIVWGVSANDRLFHYATDLITQQLWKQVLRPMKKVYSTDNGAMIGVVWLLS